MSRASLFLSLFLSFFYFFSWCFAFYLPHFFSKIASLHFWRMIGREGEILRTVLFFLYIYLLVFNKKRGDISQSQQFVVCRLSSAFWDFFIRIELHIETETLTREKKEFRNEYCFLFLTHFVV